jgi:uncharacterized Zn finger protein (UPF0148 family)
MKHKCPKCGSVIYSRRKILCGVCGERLPSELLFTAEQRAAVEKDLADLKHRAKRDREAQSGPSSDSSASSFSSTDMGSV